MHARFVVYLTYSILIILLHSTLHIQCVSSEPSPSTTTNSYNKPNKQWKIPSHMRINTEELKTFTAISSHGRDDNLIVVEQSTFRLMIRVMYLFLIFFPVIFTAPLAYISTIFRNLFWYTFLSTSMAYSGAAFIKWGQWASTRPDLFPEELCVVMSRLHSDAPRHSYAFTKSQIFMEFGDSIDNIFDTFSRQPIASGSIAQVYIASLNGRKVAVKVRHPNVAEQITMDFIIMKVIARWVESFPGLAWINLSESLSQFSATIASQTDLSVEGKHLYLFNQNFRSWNTVSFPSPIVMSESVLVESWEDGTTISEYTDLYNTDSVAKANDGQYIRAEKDFAFSVASTRIHPSLALFIVSKGVAIYLKMLLTDNLMHSDLHPGNIFVKQYDAKGKLIPAKDHLNIKENAKIVNRIVLVDAGMVARLVVDEQENFIGLLQAMGRGRGDEAAKHILKFSSRTDYTPYQITAFSRDMVYLFSKVCRGYHTNVKIGDVLKHILTLVRIHRITIEANYATLVMNALCLDSLASNLMPSYNVLDGAQSLLTFHRFARRFLSVEMFRKIAPIASAVKVFGDAIFARKLE